MMQSWYKIATLYKACMYKVIVDVYKRQGVGTANGVNPYGYLRVVFMVDEAKRPV